MNYEFNFVKITLFWRNTRNIVEIVDLQFGFFVNRQNLVAGKIISAQPTARKKIKNRRFSRFVFKLMILNSSSRYFHE